MLSYNWITNSQFFESPIQVKLLNNKNSDPSFDFVNLSIIRDFVIGEIYFLI